MNKQLRTIATVGVFAFWFFVLTNGILHPEYSHISQYISELGAKDAAYAFLMNYFGILPFGASIMILAIYLWRNLNLGLIGKVCWMILFLCGLLFLFASIFHCDQGCSFTDMSTEALRHNYTAFSAFILAALTMLLIGLILLFKKTYSPLLYVSLSLGILAFILFYIMGKTGIYSEYRGLYQRLFLVDFSIWILFISHKSNFKLFKL